MQVTFAADVPDEIAAVVLTAGWIGFAIILVRGKRGAAKGATGRDLKSRIGFFLQSLSYAICFGFTRPLFPPMMPMPKLADDILSSVAIALTIASVWFCYAAARALGKQWALDARVIEGHELIVSGPYAIVRNPIYLAMLGMLIATNTTVGRWQTLLPTIVVFAAGTVIRIRAEENLLRRTLGPEFEFYTRRVPAFFPRWTD